MIPTQEFVPAAPLGNPWAKVEATAPFSPEYAVSAQLGLELARTAVAGGATDAPADVDIRPMKVTAATAKDAMTLTQIAHTPRCTPGEPIGPQGKGSRESARLIRHFGR
jgi:hypothetical protein